MYDVIVIGARAAGAPLAMLSARAGLKVLLIDRATFPSDTLSTHLIQLKGTAALKRWGLLDKVLASNCPPVQRASLSFGDVVLRGKYPALDGVEDIICPRRFILDKLLVDAAVRAGAELRQDFLVEELLFDGEKVIGIKGHSKSSAAGSESKIEERAQLTVGADGKHSLVAQLVKAKEYNQKTAQTCGYYTYWEGLQLEEGGIYTFPDLMVSAWPSNDGLSIVFTAHPISKFSEVRKDIEGRFWQAINKVPHLSERLRQGHQAERFYGTADLPVFYRQSHGPGWALVGDAGLAMDPITGYGIGNAFYDAERLSQAIIKAYAGQMDIEEALKQREQVRDADTLPMYNLTNQLASFESPTVEQWELFSALARKPEAANRFFGTLTGSISVEEFYSMPNLRSIIGIAGMGRVMISKIIGTHSRRGGQKNPA